MTASQLHPFDSCKFSKIVSGLQTGGLLSPPQLIEPLELPIEALKDVHTDSYITSIHTSSWTVAKASSRVLGVLQGYVGAGSTGLSGRPAGFAQVWRG